MLTQLLRNPQAAIAEVLSSETTDWTIPLLAYTLIAFASGLERMAVPFANAHPLTAVGVGLLLSALIGSWTHAFVYGGIYHLGARILGGQPGASRTIRAVGYAMLWPGLLAAPAAAFTFVLERQGSPLAGLMGLLSLIAGVWAVYLTVVAIRVTHGFSWGRAIAAWILIPGTLMAAALLISRVILRA